VALPHRFLLDTCRYGYYRVLSLEGMAVLHRLTALMAFCLMPFDAATGGARRGDPARVVMVATYGWCLSTYRPDAVLGPDTWTAGRWGQMMAGG
jgi:hypothetical protein